MPKFTLIKCGICGPKVKNPDMLTFISHFNSMHVQRTRILEHFRVQDIPRLALWPLDKINFAKEMVNWLP